MVRLGGAASPTYISVFRGLQAHFSSVWHRARLGGISALSVHGLLISPFSRTKKSVA